MKKKKEQMEKHKSEKPPLGLMSKKIWDEKRFYEVCFAITKYYQDCREIPIEWIEEYNELIRKKNDHNS
jgi:hypothetical protein